MDADTPKRKLPLLAKITIAVLVFAAAFVIFTILSDDRNWSISFAILLADVFLAFSLVAREKWIRALLWIGNLIATVLWSYHLLAKENSIFSYDPSSNPGTISTDWIFSAYTMTVSFSIMAIFSLLRKRIPNRSPREIPYYIALLLMLATTALFIINQLRNWDGQIPGSIVSVFAVLTGTFAMLTIVLVLAAGRQETIDTRSIPGKTLPTIVHGAEPAVGPDGEEIFGSINFEHYVKKTEVRELVYKYMDSYLQAHNSFATLSEDPKNDPSKNITSETTEKERSITDE